MNEHWAALHFLPAHPGDDVQADNATARKYGGRWHFFEGHFECNVPKRIRRDLNIGCAPVG